MNARSRPSSRTSTRSTSVSTHPPRSPSRSSSREWPAATSATRAVSSSATRWSTRRQRRLSALNAAHDGLVFGRLDLLDGDSRYIGRIGVRDADREILLIDWRAPAAAIFYQATAQEPAGVVRRRVLRCANDQVIGVEDDLLDGDNAPDDLVVDRRGRAAGQPDPRPRQLDALGRRDDPEGAGRGDPRPQPRRHDDRRRPRHRQDRRRAAPRGLPALHRSSPVRVRRRARRRTVERLHELHRAGAAEPRRDQRDAALARRGRRRHPRRRATTSRSPRAPRARRAWTVPGPRRGSAACPARRRSSATSSRTTCCGSRRPTARPHPAPAAVDGQAQPRATPPRAAVLVEALWRQVRGDRALEKGEEAFVEIVTTDDRVRRLRRAVVASGRADRGLAHAARRSSSGLAGTFTRVEQQALRRVVGRRAEHPGRPADRRAALPRGRGPGPRRRRRRQPEAADELRASRARGPRRPATADPEHRGRRLRARAGRRGAGPLADAVAHARPSRPHRQLDDRRRRGAVVVAAPAGVGRGAQGRARRQARARASGCRPTTATPPRSTSSPPRSRAIGVARPRPRRRRASHRRATRGTVVVARGDLLDRAARRGRRRSSTGSRAPSRSWRRARVDAVAPSWPSWSPSTTTGCGCSTVSTPRAWSSTASWSSSPTASPTSPRRLAHALRRADPRHPAARRRWARPSLVDGSAA